MKLHVDMESFSLVVEDVPGLPGGMPPVPLLSVRDRACDATTLPVAGVMEATPERIRFRTEGSRACEVELDVTGDTAMRLRIREARLAAGSLPERMRQCAAAPVLQLLPGLWSMAVDETAAGLALPVCEGIWVPAGRHDLRHVVKGSHVLGLSMGFWAVCREAAGSIVGISDHAYLEFLVEGDASGLRWIPEFLRDPDGIDLEMDIVFLSGGHAVDAALAYRRHINPASRGKPLSARVAEGSAMASLAGGANIKFMHYVHREPSPGGHDHAAREESITRVHTFADVAQICAQLRADGVDKAMAIFWGWGIDGYDRLHPDFLPANPWAGGDTGLRCASDAIRTLGYAVGGHDNYQDIYQNAPSFGEGGSVCRCADGRLREGGFWSGGRCYIQCSADALRFAERNLPVMKERYGWNAVFIDTTTAAELYECYSETHPRTREDDRRDKLTLIDHARSLFGCFGSETGMAWSFGHVDYWEGILNARADHANWWWYWRLLGAVEIPLWAAVYREWVPAYLHQSRGLRSKDPEAFLICLRSAQPPYYFFNEGFFPDEMAYVRKTYAVLAWLHRHTLDAHLAGHGFLRLDGQGRVEESRFNDGTRIIINNSTASFDLAGEAVTLCPHGWLLSSAHMAGFYVERAGHRCFDVPLWAVVRREADGRLVVFADGELPADIRGMLVAMLHGAPADAASPHAGSM